MTTKIQETYEAAGAADSAYEAAVQAAGFKSRWDVPADMAARYMLPAALVAAYEAKIAADRAHIAAWGAFNAWRSLGAELEASNEESAA